MTDIVDGKRRYKFNNFNPDNIINRSMVISGQSETGKSYVLNSIMSSISKKVGRVFAFASTATADDKFPLDKYTHPGLIRKDLDMQLIRKLHLYLEEHKSKLAGIKEPSSIQMYAKATVMLLVKTSHKFGGHEKVMMAKIETKIKSVRKVKATLMTKKGQNMPKEERDKLKKEVVDAYVWVVVKGCQILFELAPKTVPAALKKAYECLIFNSKTVIIINDLSSEIGSLSKDDVKIFQSLLDKGRHSDLTVIILLHDWACMKKELRNAVHNHIFTSIEMVNNFVSIQQYRGETAKALRDGASAIIQKDRDQPEGKRKYSMMFWMRLTGHIEYVIADVRGKQVPVGMKYYYELAKKQQKKDDLF